MTVALVNVGCHGRMDLTFGVRNGQTILRDSYCEVPFKITRPVSSSPSGTAHLILMHTTAGIFGGDQLECSLHIESGARVHITQQAATRVHPSDKGVARQSMRIQVDSGASLHMDLEPIIPFAQSRYHQCTQINVDRGGSLAYWECMMAGRIGSHEEWQFDEFASETRLNVAGRTMFLDRYLLKPSVMHLKAPWVMGEATYTGTGLYYGLENLQFAKDLHDAIPDSGIDLVSDLVLTRVTSSNGPDFHFQRRTWNQLANR